MRSLFYKIIAGVLMVFTAFTLSNCQTSDSSDSESSESYSSPSAETGSSALNISSKVSLVEAQDDATYSGTAETGSAPLYLDTKSVRAAIDRTIDPGTFAAGSDYNQDQTEFWVHEDSVQAFRCSK